MNVRARQRATTRSEILEAAARLLAEGDPVAMSIPAVAEASGISVRTIYRYFATKAELIEAVSVLDDPATVGPLPAFDGSDLHAWLRRGWSAEVQTPLLRAQLRTAAGAEVRRARRLRHRAFAEGVIDAWEIDVSGDEREALVDLLLLLTGGAAFVELTDVLGADVRRAAGAAAWAVEAVLTHAKETGAVADGSHEFAMTRPGGGNHP